MRLSGEEGLFLNNNIPVHISSPSPPPPLFFMTSDKKIHHIEIVQKYYTRIPQLFSPERCLGSIFLCCATYYDFSTSFFKSYPTHYR